MIEAKYGSVHLKDYVPMQAGQHTRVLTGKIVVREAFDAIGVKVARSEANWFAEIAGDTQTVYVPGCQIRAISQHPEDTPLCPPRRPGRRDVRAQSAASPRSLPGVARW